jgi:phage tail sheath protein FI
MPSLTEEAAQQVFVAMIDQCERLRDRVAIIDAPRNRSTASLITEWRNRFDSKFAALYYPWLKVPDPLRGTPAFRDLPPGGHLAGVYAQVDTAFGVHRPPANVALEGVVDVVDTVTSLEQEHLNPVSVNVLRSFPGRGIRVWGARSLDRQDSRWRFIHARRLLSMIEESTYHSTQWAVFEPNDQNLRRTLTHSLSVFLRAIWQQGGLEGTSPDEAYFVKCDETNNPPTVVDAGQVVCQVGVAIAAPMEFLVFDLRQTPTGPLFAEG